MNIVIRCARCSRDDLPIAIIENGDAVCSKCITKDDQIALPHQEDDGECGKYCPHGRPPMNGVDGWRHCPHCLGINNE